MTVYWNNGGHLSFSKEGDIYHSKIGLYVPTQMTTLDGETYLVTLTDKRVETNKEDIEKFKKYKTEQLKEIDHIQKESFRKIENFRKEVISDINKLLTDVCIDFPYFSSLIADYRYNLNLKYSNELLRKKPPAPKAAKAVKNIAKKLREEEKKNKLLTYQQQVYEDYFPWITYYKEIPTKIEDVTIDEPEGDTEEEQLRYYLSPEEYSKLSRVEKYQLALERYKQRKKNSSEIGLLYEYYIGYKYEMDGYHVIYHGATKGKKDLGRDIIATKDSNTIVIQCKFWSQKKKYTRKSYFSAIWFNSFYCIRRKFKL